MPYRRFKDRRRHWACIIRYTEPIESSPNIFLVEEYAIGSDTQYSINRNYRNREIAILSDSQVAIQALSFYTINFINTGSEPFFGTGDLVWCGKDSEAGRRQKRHTQEKLSRIETSVLGNFSAA